LKDKLDNIEEKQRKIFSQIEKSSQADQQNLGALLILFDHFKDLSTYTVDKINITTSIINSLFEFLKRRNDTKVNKITMEEYLNNKGLSNYVEYFKQEKILFCEDLAYDDEELFYKEIAPIALNKLRILEKDKNDYHLNKLKKKNLLR